MKQTLLCLAVLVLSVATAIASIKSPVDVVAHEQPIEVAKRIGDRLIRHTTFQYRLVLPQLTDDFADGMQVVDFGRTFGRPPSSDASAWAFTHLVAEANGDYPVQIDHSGTCRLWLNGTKVYEATVDTAPRLTIDERSVELSRRTVLSLREGVNTLLVECTPSTDDGGWMVYLQTEPNKMRVQQESQPKVNIGLKTVVNVDPAVSALSHWLVCGPLPFGQTAVPTNIIPGAMYVDTNGRHTTWTIPKTEVLVDVIDPAPWGTPYNWNYHNGGTAWAMQQLSLLTGLKRYDDYAMRFCQFHLDSRDLIAYEVDGLHAFNCTNHHLHQTPLLDFTLAPSLPFVYRLTLPGADTIGTEWRKWVNEMLDYSHRQIRLPGRKAFTRTTPEEYTTWVDDMFMGIPFLVHAARYTGDNSYMDDAVNQVTDFNREVWDTNARLYMHAHYSQRPEVKLPHWSRANGWGLWAITEVLTYLPHGDRRREALLNHYRQHVAQLVKYQAANGFWYNVLEYPESRSEVSATAIFTLAIARGIRMGWLPAKTYRPVVEHAWQAIASQVDADGTVHNICYGTMCSEDVNYYINRPFYDNDTHGLFAVLFAAMEMELLNIK